MPISIKWARKNIKKGNKKSQNFENFSYSTSSLRLNVHVVEKHLANASCTCFTKVLFTNARIFFLLKFFYKGSSPLGIIEKTICGTKKIQQPLMVENPWSQTI
jgi:hypothetical protein